MFVCCGGFGVLAFRVLANLAPRCTPTRRLLAMVLPKGSKVPI